MTAQTLPTAAAPRVPSFWRAFAALLDKERRQNALILGLAVLALVLAQLAIAWRVRPVSAEVPPRFVLVAALSIVPVLWGLLKGVAQIRSEFAHNTHTLLSSLPVSGLAVVLAKYVWLWCEVAVLSLVTVAGVFVFVGLDIGWSRLLSAQAAGQAVFLDGRLALELAKLTLIVVLALAPLPAFALLATVVGRLARRFEVLLGFVAYVALIFLGAELVRQVAALHLNWPGITVGSSFPGALGANNDVDAPGELIALSLALTAALLWVAGRLFERQDA